MTQAQKSTVNRKLQVVGGSLDRALQPDGSILTTERVNLRAGDGTCEIQIVVGGNDVGVLELGAHVALTLTLP